MNRIGIPCHNNFFAVYLILDHLTIKGPKIVSTILTFGNKTAFYSYKIINGKYDNLNILNKICHLSVLLAIFMRIGSTVLQCKNQTILR